jgi:hypothetical protein
MPAQNRQRSRPCPSSRRIPLTAHRAQNFQTWSFDQTTGILLNEKKLELFTRYEATYNRAFNIALNQLLKLRAKKQRAKIGFEAQGIAAEKHQMEKEAH